MSAVTHENLKQPSYDLLGNLAFTITEQAEEQDDLTKALRLSGILQTSLDAEKIIEIFTHHIGKLVDYKQVSYQNKEVDINLCFGKEAKHAANYRLVVSGESLGELRFTRSKKFTKSETDLIESLLCGLVYPLRNALLYQKALDAAHRDPLTGVNNRTSMDETIDREIQLAHRHTTPLSLLAMDVDHFKQVNDTYGHAIGDCILKAIADAAKSAMRTSDIIFRYGGEEFLILLSNTSRGGARLLANRLRKRVADTLVDCEGHNLSATVSIGISCLQTGDGREQLFSRADAGLYEAKAAGRNCCKFYTPD